MPSPFSSQWEVNNSNTISFIITNAAGLELPGLGAGFTVWISKNGGPFLAGIGAKSEVGLGMYKYISTPLDANQLGHVILVITAPGARQQNLLYQVVTILSPTALPVTYAGRWEANTQNPCYFIISDPAGTELVGLGFGFTPQVSQNGGGFIPGVGVKSEVGLGWYKYVSDVTESDQLGYTEVVVTAPGAQQQNLLYEVTTAFIPAPPAAGARFAEAWQFASFFCVRSLISGIDRGASFPPLPNALLSDPYQNFLIHGARANVGQVLYNLSRSMSGPITIATETTLGAVGVDWYSGETYRVVFLNAAEIAQVEHYLNVTAGDIWAALGAAGATGCTLSSWGANFLAEINIILARLFYDCPCAPNLSDTEKSKYAEIASERLKQIRSGEVDVCSGATGALFPAVGFAEQSHTEWNAARIIVNDRDRSATP